MQNTIKIDKRIREQSQRILRAVKGAGLPDGKYNAILNSINAINGFADKASRIMASPIRHAPSSHACYDARTNEDIAEQMLHKKAVMAALQAGRRVSLKDSREFRLSQMHTAIAQIRRDIQRQNLPYILCDEWVRPEGGRPYKQYWIIETQPININQ